MIGRRHGIVSWVALCVVLGVFVLCVQTGAAGAEYVSPFAVVAHGSGGGELFVAEYTADRVAVFRVDKSKVSKEIKLPDAPSGLAVSPDGSRLYVTGVAAGASGGRGLVHAVDTSSGKIIFSLPAGHMPNAPVVSPDGSRLYVCNRFDNDVAVYDVAARKEVARIAVLREPVAAATTPDGRHLFVANHLPTDAADLDYVAAVVSVIDTSSRTCAGTIQLPNGSTGLRGVCISPGGEHAYVTHILARYQLPTTQLERGWMNTNALSVIDVAGKKLINTVLLDEVDRGAANPWGVACSDDGKWVCVAHAGTHEVSVIDQAALHDKLERVARGEQVSEVSQAPEDVPNDLAFLVGMRRRLRLAGNGARGLAILDGKAYATEYFSGSLGVVDLNPDAMHRPRSLSLGSERAMSTARKGEMFFNDAALCFQNWQSCASCHPDGRADGLNWDLLNDGMGNPKNTKSLVLSHETPPAMISGARDDTETAVRSGIRFIQFAVRPEEDAAAIDEYLKSVAPVKSPYLVDGGLSQAAVRGRDVFERAKCGACHSGRLYTDLGQYNVGTGKNREVDLKFDTPTLVEAWRTAPYLHDGRAVTMRGVLKEHNLGDRHGVTSSLTEDQLNDLSEFVLSL